MAEEIVSDDTRLIITVDNCVGDEVQFTKYANGGLGIEIDEPWAGSTETGFGAQTSIDLTPEQVDRFVAWLGSR